MTWLSQSEVVRLAQAQKAWHKVHRHFVQWLTCQILLHHRASIWSDLQVWISICDLLENCEYWDGKVVGSGCKNCTEHLQLLHVTGPQKLLALDQFYQSGSRQMSYGTVFQVVHRIRDILNIVECGASGIKIFDITNM